MQLHPIRAHGTEIQDLPGFGLDLRIKKQDFLPLTPSFFPNLQFFMKSVYLIAAWKSRRGYVRRGCFRLTKVLNQDNMDVSCIR